MELKAILEAILFASHKPLSPRELRDLLDAAAEQSEDPAVRSFRKLKEPEITAALEQLEQDYASAGRSYGLASVAGAWQFVSRPEFAPWLKVLVGEKIRPARLSQPALETLTIIAYRQPLTRAEIEQIRGVSVDGVMQTLLERGLIEQAGRAEVPGRPMTYATTRLFLEYFGLRSLEELPAADELRRIPIQKPEGLPTLEPGPQPAGADPNQPGEPPTAGSPEPAASAEPAEPSEPSDAPAQPESGPAAQVPAANSTVS